jgi:hypothetical protein
MLYLGQPMMQENAGMQASNIMFDLYLQVPFRTRIRRRSSRGIAGHVKSL